jgi:hypothetical protein
MITGVFVFFLQLESIGSAYSHRLVVWDDMESSIDSAFDGRASICIHED